jgi:hypothetical protein
MITGGDGYAKIFESEKAAEEFWTNHRTLSKINDYQIVELESSLI